jgi:hypothetical protein
LISVHNIFKHFLALLLQHQPDRIVFYYLAATTPTLPNQAAPTETYLLA